jgi:hypothetical protein
MAVPVLKVNLAPPSNLWRTHHVLLGWSALALGGMILAGSLTFTWIAYEAAAQHGKLAGNLTAKTRAAADSQARILSELRNVDVARELPRWRLAERIYTERSLPWSRLAAELERSLVQDVRLRSVQRTRGSDQKVQLKIKGEARTREAEADFVESLLKNPFFEQVTLEREGERQGGGVDFDYTLGASSNPPRYQPLPKHGPPLKKTAPGKAAVPGKPAVPPYRGVAVPTPAAPQRSRSNLPAPGAAAPVPVQPAPRQPGAAAGEGSGPPATPFRRPPAPRLNPLNPGPPSPEAAP